MLVSGIKSKPVYRGMQPDWTGNRHIIIAQAQGQEAVWRLMDALCSFPARMETHFAGPDAERLPAFFAHGAENPVRHHASEEELLQALGDILRTAAMGVRLYICGHESFIWQVNQLAIGLGICDDEIQREEVGPAARTVYCIHCTHVSQRVTTNVFQCPRCAYWLLVRDHFSKRLNAYMGVCVNAEDPSEQPAIEEVFK